MIEGDEKSACCKVYPKANSWILNNIKNIKLFPVKGKLGLFEINETLNKK